MKENLSPMEEQVLYLHLTGTDYKKIAELLKKSPKSIDNALQRIKKKTVLSWCNRCNRNYLEHWVSALP